MAFEPLRAGIVSGCAAALLLLSPLPALADTPPVALGQERPATEAAPANEGEGLVEKGKTPAADVVGEDREGLVPDGGEGGNQQVAPEPEPRTTDESPAAAIPEATTATDAAAPAGGGEASPAAGDPGKAAETSPKTREERGAAADRGEKATAVEPQSRGSEDAVSTEHVFRLYNPHDGEHLFTRDVGERNGLLKIGWRYEGIAWNAPVVGKVVYRLYNPNSGDHHYTMDRREYDTLGVIGWSLEGLAWHSASADEGMPVYRQFNPNETIGTHHYTTSKHENDVLVSYGWVEEGVAWYGLPCSEVVATVETADGGEVTVRSSWNGDSAYLVLPSHASTRSVGLQVTTGGRATRASLALPGGNLGISARGTAVDLSAAIGKALRFGPGSIPGQSLVVLKSARLDTVYVSSVDPGRGRGWVEASPDHSAKASVDVLVVDSGGAHVYDADGARHSTIKGRGNSTWTNGIKKPYQISLGKKADLLRTGKRENANKKWILLANEADPTLIHSALGYDMALELGLIASEGTSVDLYYDGEYRGTYYLCEKVQVGPGRVDITKLEDEVEAANRGVDLDGLPTARGSYSHGGRTYAYQYVRGVRNPADISGGYLIERDGAYYHREKCWFETSLGAFVVKSPEVASGEQVLYVARQFQAAIDAMQGNRFNLPGQPSFDLDSLAKATLINEFTKNIDYFFSSTYFYKERGSSVIHAGPIWDFDASMGIRFDRGSREFSKYSGYSVLSLWPVRDIPAVRERGQQVWREQLSPLMHNVVLGGRDAVGAGGRLRSLAHYRSEIAASQVANQALFGIGHFGNELTPWPTYDQNYHYLRDWLTWRTSWYDESFARAARLVDHGSSHGGTNYGWVYDYEYYVRRHPEVVRAVGRGGDAVLAYFIRHDMPRGVQASLNFNPATYRGRYRDLLDAFGADWSAYYRHFMDYGFLEGRRAV